MRLMSAMLLSAQTLLCYAAKRAAAAASSSTPEPLPGLPSLAATANFNTKVMDGSLVVNSSGH